MGEAQLEDFFKTKKFFFEGVQLVPNFTLFPIIFKGNFEEVENFFFDSTIMSFFCSFKHF